MIRLSNKNDVLMLNYFPYVFTGLFFLQIEKTPHHVQTCYRLWGKKLGIKKFVFGLIAF